MEISFSFDTAAIAKKIEARTHRAQMRLDAQIIKDSNYYCPKDTGALQKSVLGSVLGSGRLVWSIEYAKKMYHFAGIVSKDSNPNASVKWFERAKAANKERWAKVANDEYNR
jgi:hypothetical protein